MTSNSSVNNQGVGGVSLTMSSSCVSNMATSTAAAADGPTYPCRQSPADSHSSKGKAQRLILPKPVAASSSLEQNSIVGEGRQGAILDVKSIIADFRSKNPENTPKRGRRPPVFAKGMSMGMGMGMGNPMADAESKKNLKTLTRTDFLLQFIWQPPKPEEQPKTDEERDAKIKEIIEKVTEAEKKNPAVTMPKVEDLQAASLKKTEELDAKIQSALTPVAPGGAGGVPGPGTPGFGTSPAGAGTAPGGAAAPATKGASPPGQ